MKDLMRSSLNCIIIVSINKIFYINIHFLYHFSSLVVRKPALNPITLKSRLFCVDLVNPQAIPPAKMVVEEITILVIKDF